MATLIIEIQHSTSLPCSISSAGAFYSTLFSYFHFDDEINNVVADAVSPGSHMMMTLKLQQIETT